MPTPDRYRKSPRPVDPVVLELKQLRLKAGLTQRDLAGEIRMPQPSISDMERGITSPTLVTLARLTKFFGVQLTLKEVLGED